MVAGKVKSSGIDRSELPDRVKAPVALCFSAGIAKFSITPFALFGGAGKGGIEGMERARWGGGK